MFEKLGELRMVRTNKQAVGFYLAYLLGFVLLGALIGGVMGAIFGDIIEQTAFKVGGLMSVALTLGLGSAILNKKKLNNETNLWLVVLAGGVLALFGGGILGLVPVAYLTTKKPRK